MENYNDIQKVKLKRANSFMGAHKEIKTLPKTRPQELIKIKNTQPPKLETPIMCVTTTPIENNIPALKAEQAVEKAAPIKTEPPEVKEDKLTIQRGFIVGRTEDGKVLFKPFGNPDKLELIGFVEYAKAVSSDILNELANTTTHEIKTLKAGVGAALTGIKALLDKSETK